MCRSEFGDLLHVLQRRRSTAHNKIKNASRDILIFSRELKVFGFHAARAPALRVKNNVRIIYIILYFQSVHDLNFGINA